MHFSFCVLDKINNCLLNKHATFCLSGSLKSWITKAIYTALTVLKITSKA